jgi:hypothetical protein
MLLFRGRRSLIGCQCTHFGCYDCKTASLFTYAGRLYRRMERQNIGLKCNAFDDPGNFNNLTGGFRGSTPNPAEISETPVLLSVPATFYRLGAVRRQGQDAGKGSVA